MEENTMATVTINYDEKNTAIRSMILALLKFDGVTEVKANEPDGYDETLKAIRDVKAGKGTRYKNFDEFKKKMHAL